MLAAHLYQLSLCFFSSTFGRDVGAASEIRVKERVWARGRARIAFGSHVAPRDEAKTQGRGRRQN